MNDQQQHFSSKSCRSRVTCTLPGCGKEVLHFAKHLKNIHSMSATEYLVRLEERKESKRKRESAPLRCGTLHVNESNKTVRKAKSDKHCDKDNKNTSEVLKTVSESELAEELNEQDVSHFNESPSGDEHQLQTCKQSQHAEMILQELTPTEFSEEKLRYLVHNTTADGVRFLLVFLKRKGSLEEFYRTELCKTVLGNMPYSTIADIFLCRKYLTSFYRMSRYYPYPDKEMISNCLACDVIQKGQCSCPVLSKAFYVFCRQKCSSDLNCRKCVQFDHRLAHCFDFFHCQRCDAQYKASSRHQPYP